jgi:hypothetical protein
MNARRAGAFERRAEKMTEVLPSLARYSRHTADASGFFSLSQLLDRPRA